MTNRISQKIDIVITWVDFNDPKWQKEYSTYSDQNQKKNRFVGGEDRYVPQDTFKYLFRGIEKFAPWVNKVFFVTYGHTPSWLNLKCEKLVLVKHEDFIPEEYLPTFNSNTILLNLHRIKDLSENFILFNDDMYITNFCKETDFFKNGLPCDMAVVNPIVAPDFDPFWDMMINNVCLINKNFSKKTTFRKNVLGWFNFKYGFKNNIRNICSLPYRKFSGFYDLHLPNSHLKSVFNEVWDKEFDILNSTCLNKFRTNNDLTEWVMKYWQFASNKFKPIKKQKFGYFLSLKDNSYKRIFDSKKMPRLICLNDDKKDMKDVILFFERILGEKSSFEIL